MDIREFLRRVWRTHWELLGDIVGALSLAGLLYMILIVGYTIAP